MLLYLLLYYILVVIILVIYILVFSFMLHWFLFLFGMRLLVFAFIVGIWFRSLVFIFVFT